MESNFHQLTSAQLSLVCWSTLSMLLKLVSKLIPLIKQAWSTSQSKLELKKVSGEVFGDLASGLKDMEMELEQLGL